MLEICCAAQHLKTWRGAQPSYVCPWENNDKLFQSFGRHKYYRILPTQAKSTPNRAAR